MSLLLVSVLSAAALLVLAFLGRRFLAYRGPRVIVCPETLQPAGVELNAWLATGASAIGETVLELQNCSRWPQREHCGQECLSQIQACGEGTLVRNIVTTWYRDKCCAFCARPISAIEWHDALPALRRADGSLQQWSGIAAADVPEVMATSEAVCWNCSITESFRREHPELVIDRGRTPLRETAIH